jgi:hypothetical protein
VLDSRERIRRLFYNVSGEKWNGWREVQAIAPRAAPTRATLPRAAPTLAAQGKKYSRLYQQNTSLPAVIDCL